MSRTLVPAVLLAFAALPSGASEVDISFNDSAFRAAFGTDLRRDLKLDLGWLHDADAGDVVHAGLLVMGEASVGPNPVRAGVGGRVVGFDGEGRHRDGYALAVGGSVRWQVPRYDRFTLGGEAWFSPDVLTGKDAENYVDLTARAGYAITRQADAYVGVRYVRAEYERRPDNHFDTGMHLGLNLRF